MPKSLNTIRYGAIQTTHSIFWKIDIILWKQRCWLLNAKCEMIEDSWLGFCIYVVNMMRNLKINHSFWHPFDFLTLVSICFYNSSAQNIFPLSWKSLKLLVTHVSIKHHIILFFWSSKIASKATFRYAGCVFFLALFGFPCKCSLSFTCRYQSYRFVSVYMHRIRDRE